MNKKMIFYVLFCMGIAFYGDVCAMNQDQSAQQDKFALIECCPDPYRFGPINDSEKTDEQKRAVETEFPDRETLANRTKWNASSVRDSFFAAVDKDDYYLAKHLISLNIHKKLSSDNQNQLCGKVKSKALMELVPQFTEKKNRYSYEFFLQRVCDYDRRLDLMKYCIDEMRESFEQEQVEQCAEGVLNQFAVHALSMPNDPRYLACAKKKIDMLIEVEKDLAVMDRTMRGPHRNLRVARVGATFTDYRRDRSPSSDQSLVLGELCSHYIQQVELRIQHHNANNVVGALDKLALGDNASDDDDDAMEE